MPVEPTPEVVAAVLAGRGFTDVPAETIEELVPAVRDLWELGRQVSADLLSLMDGEHRG